MSDSASTSNFGADDCVETCTISPDSYIVLQVGKKSGNGEMIRLKTNTCLSIEEASYTVDNCYLYGPHISFTANDVYGNRCFFCQSFTLTVISVVDTTPIGIFNKLKAAGYITISRTMEMLTQLCTLYSLLLTTVLYQVKIQSSLKTVNISHNLATVTLSTLNFLALDVKWVLLELYSL